MATKQDISATVDYTSYAKDIGFVAAAQVAVSLMHFLRLPILTKWLGASLYGTWSLIWVTVTLVTPLAMLGLGMAMIRFLAPERDADRIREGFLSIVFTVIAASALVSIILVLCSDLFTASILDDINSSNLVKLASLMILTQSISRTGIAFFRTFRQMRWYSGLVLATATTELGLMFCFLLLGWELTGVIIAVLASDTLCIAIAFFISLRQVGFRFPKFTQLGTYLRYGLPLVPSSAILWIIHSSDRYIISYFMGSRDVGIYTAAYTLANVLGLFLIPLQVVLLPTISKAYDDGNTARTRTYLQYTFKYLMLLMIPSAAGLSILASPLLSILTDTEFVAGSTVIPFVASGIIFYGLYQVCIYIIFLTKKTYWVLTLFGISAALNLCLNLLLVPSLGIIGAAIATSISYGVLGITTMVISFRHLKFDLGLTSILKSIIASAIMLLAVWLLSPRGLMEVTISVLLGMAIYFGIILALKGFSKNELNLLKNLVAGSNIKRS